MPRKILCPRLLHTWSERKYPRIMPETDLKTFADKLYARASSRRLDHFEVLGLTQSATFAEIDSAYRRLAAFFSEQRLAALDGESAARARELRRRFQRAHEVLTDYAKRHDYESRGFKEAGETEKVEQPADTARRIFAKAKALFAQKQFALALELAEKALEADPRAEHHHLRGLCLMNIRHRRHEAEAALLKAVEIEPWNAGHVLALGMMFYNEKLPQRALGYFKKTLELDSANAQAREKVEWIEGPPPTTIERLRAGLARRLGKAMPTFFPAPRKK